MKTLTVSLPQKMLDTLHEAVLSGDYASNSEVVREALRLWEQWAAERALEMQRLKQAYEEGMASGAPRAISGEEFLSELKASKRGAA